MAPPQYPDDPRCALHEKIVLEMRESQRRIETLLTGNGDPSKGMIVRLDRLEQAHETQSKLIWSVVGGLVGTIGIALKSLFK